MSPEVMRMRLFIALELPGDVRERLARSAASLETSWTSGRLIPAENYHLTLVFLGEVPEGRLEDIAEAMEACPSPPLTLTVGAFGRFRQRGGDVVWRRVSGGNALFSLQRRLTRELERRGFTLEKREYSPHLTLGRKVILRTGLPEARDELPFTVGAMTLFRSDTGRSGAVYTPLRQVDLSKELIE